MSNHRPGLSIDEIEPSGAISVVRFGHRHWTMIYLDVRAALADAVALGLLDDATAHMKAYRLRPRDWSLFAILLDGFEEDVLKRHGWKLERHSAWVM